MSDEVESLSSILGDSPFSTGAAKADPTPPVVEQKVEAPAKVEPEVKEPAQAEAKTEEPKAEKPRDESGKFKKPEPMVPLSALLAERAKGRREPEESKPKTSVFDDEDKGISERLEEHTAPLRQSLFEMSVELARGRHDDFDEAAEAFAKAAENDQRLWKSMREAGNPANYIYTVGSQIRELSDVGGDFVKYREKVTGDLKTKIAALEAENAALKTAKTDLDAVPRSLNTLQSGAAPKGTDADPEDINQLVRFKAG